MERSNKVKFAVVGLAAGLGVSALISPAVNAGTGPRVSNKAMDKKFAKDLIARVSVPGGPFVVGAGDAPFSFDENPKSTKLIRPVLDIPGFGYKCNKPGVDKINIAGLSLAAYVITASDKVIGNTVTVGPNQFAQCVDTTDPGEGHQTGRAGVIFTSPDKQGLMPMAITFSDARKLGFYPTK